MDASSSLSSEIKRLAALSVFWLAYISAHIALGLAETYPTCRGLCSTTGAIRFALAQFGYSMVGAVFYTATSRNFAPNGAGYRLAAGFSVASTLAFLAFFSALN